MTTRLVILLLFFGGFGRAVDVWRWTGSAWTVNTGGGEPYADTCAGLQSALNTTTTDATVTEIRLTAGATYSASGSGCIQFPVFSQAGRVVLVRGSNYRNFPPDGTRLCPPANGTGTPQGCTSNIAQADFPIITDQSGLVVNTPALVRFAAGTHGWILDGLEMSGFEGASSVGWHIIEMLPATVYNPDLSAQTASDPYDIVFKHVWMHGLYDQRGPRGVLNGAGSFTVADSYCEEAKYDVPGSDAQCIEVRDGPGPVKIINSAVLDGTESMMIGGSQSMVYGSFPAGILIFGSYFQKNPWHFRMFHTADPAGACASGSFWKNTTSGSWFQCTAGTWGATGLIPSSTIYNTTSGTLLQTTNKNSFELKTGNHYWIRGNQIGGSWADTTASGSNQPNTVQLTNTESDCVQNGIAWVRMEYNLIQHTDGGGNDWGKATGACNASYHPTGAKTPMHDVWWQHNVWNNIASPAYWCPSGVSCWTGLAFMRAAAPSIDPPYTVRHNTVVNINSTASQLALISSPSSATVTNVSYGKFLDNAGPWGNFSGPLTGSGGPNVAQSLNPNDAFAHHWAPNGELSGTVIGLNAFNASGTNKLAYLTPSTWVSPTGALNYMTATIEGAMVNAAGGDYRLAAGNNCGVTPTSTGSTVTATTPCQAKATDGTDPGADIPSVAAFTSGNADGANIVGQADATTATGLPNKYLGFLWPFAWTTIASGATVYYQAPDAVACTAQLSTSETMSSPIAGTETVSGTAHHAVFAGLAGKTSYYLTVTCGSATRREYPITTM